MSTPARLNALDAAFLDLDAMGSPYLVGAVLVFERAPLCTPQGKLDIARIRAFLEAGLDRAPRYRQRLVRVPLLRHRVWVDDRDFSLDFHLRLATLPSPGSMEQLDELAGRIFSEDIAPDRPPWQMWLVDGVGPDCVALVSKMHHCLVDGVAGIKLLELMMRGTPDAKLPARLPWSPEPVSPLALLRQEVTHRLKGMRGLPGLLRSMPVKALGTLVRRGLHPASDAGMNPRRVGHNRRLVRLELDLADVRRVKAALGTTLNDVVLATAAGGFRRFLTRRGVDVSRLTDFRAMVPASTHVAGDADTSGNRVALMLVQLPITEPDARLRIEKVHAETLRLKGEAQETQAGELLCQVSDVTMPSLLTAILGLSVARRGFNVIITNVPGPPFSLYLLGAKLRSFHPVINLWPRQSIGIALCSYAGTLHFTVHVDRRAVPDVEELVRDLGASFAELAALAPTVAKPVTPAVAA